jgi:hypothetical protein
MRITLTLRDVIGVLRVREGPMTRANLSGRTRSARSTRQRPIDQRTHELDPVE